MLQLTKLVSSSVKHARARYVQIMEECFDTIKPTSVQVLIADRTFCGNISILELSKSNNVKMPIGTLRVAEHEVTKRCLPVSVQIGFFDPKVEHRALYSLRNKCRRYIDIEAIR